MCNMTHISTRSLTTLMSAALLSACANAPLRNMPPPASPVQPLPSRDTDETPSVQTPTFPIQPILPKEEIALPTDTTTNRPAEKLGVSLLGRHYQRALIPPRTVFGDWSVVLRMPDRKNPDRDFLLVAREDARVAMIAQRGRIISGMTYRYSVSAEKMVPDQYQKLPVVMCRSPHAYRANVFAALPDQKHGSPVWAVLENETGGLRTLKADELAKLRCTKPPAGKKRENQVKPVKRHHWA